MAVTGACWYRGQHFARASAAGLAAAHVRNEPCATQLCFSCGMCLVDTGNGLLMLATYNWAKVRPSEKIFYNFLVTSMSATIALCIGTLELLQVGASAAQRDGGGGVPTGARSSAAQSASTVRSGNPCPASTWPPSATASSSLSL
ncbi:unnamed protein product [Prorocentrum cordatum]|uniref:Nickel/cobalt efflux system n=1 Tax=Prorocentrum cordatum TaxID=2364126 RepID=A0ABN9VMG5_9DINO|nr:unnamed protein product [Polarella glacialis]